MFFHACQILRCKVAVPIIDAASGQRRSRYSKTDQPVSTMAKVRQTPIEPLPPDRTSLVIGSAASRNLTAALHAQKVIYATFRDRTEHSVVSKQNRSRSLRFPVRARLSLEHAFNLIKGRI